VNTSHFLSKGTKQRRHIETAETEPSHANMDALLNDFPKNFYMESNYLDRGGELNRREFGKAALGVATATLVRPVAFAATLRTILACVVIDYDKNRKSWHHLDQPDEAGRTSVYQDSSRKDKYRHFEFLGNDGLVVGLSTKREHWTQGYDAFEEQFMTFYMSPSGKRFTQSEFKRYVENVRIDLNGHFVEIQDLGS